jgi:uncharacterized protein YbaP (TraB family)
MLRALALAFLLFSTGALADMPAGIYPPSQGVPESATPLAASPMPVLRAHPALWKVVGKRGTVYLFGSLHLLPPNVDWHARNITRAIAASDVFVFETPEDQDMLQKVQALIANEGMLPKGESLRALLPADVQGDYDTELAQLGISAQAVDGKRPWLVSLLMEVTQIMKESNASPDSGVDLVLMREATADHKPMRYLETIEQQIALIVPNDSNVELQEFEASLKEAHAEKDDYADFVAAWSGGDTARIDALMSGEFTQLPGARKALLDDRNRAWLGKIEGMLDEDGTFFVTVGVGHLVGPAGVPALLPAAGYAVEGP